MFIVIDGPDGSGKTSLALEVSRDFELAYLRFPGHTRIGEKLRDALLDPTLSWTPKASFFGMLADMVQTAETYKISSPESRIVCDRYAASTMAYQVYPVNNGWTDEQRICAHGVFAKFIPKPDFSIFLDCSYETSMSRVASRKSTLDAFERAHRTVWEDRRNTYLRLSKMWGVPVINTDTISHDDVKDIAYKLINEFLRKIDA